MGGQITLAHLGIGGPVTSSAWLGNLETTTLRHSSQNTLGIPTMIGCNPKAWEDKEHATSLCHGLIPSSCITLSFLNGCYSGRPCSSTKGI